MPRRQKWDRSHDRGQDSGADTAPRPSPLIDYDDGDGNDTSPVNLIPDDDDAQVSIRHIRALWERLDRLKSRGRRETGEISESARSAQRQVDAIGFKMKIVWGLLTVLGMAAIGGAISAASFFYSRGTTEAEASMTMRSLVESRTQDSSRLRALEEHVVRILQRLEDRSNRRDSSAAPTRGTDP